MKPIYNTPIVLQSVPRLIFFYSRDTVDFYLADYPVGSFGVACFGENKYVILNFNIKYKSPDYELFINKAKKLLILK
jgi:hypothetical protein